ncbi:MAG: alpha-glucan family phosphorylase [Planctomycetaceae bacterium]|nr:alpha-glucan family phosphorylase [Planctomycetaceae bacterium]
MLQGILVLQTTEHREFSQDDAEKLVSVAAEVNDTVSRARSLDQFIAPSQQRLWSVAGNLWWSWQHEGTQVFRDLSPVRWRELDHNPSGVLSELPLVELQERASQLVLHSRINHVYHRLQEYLKSGQTWGATNCGILKARPVAYFSAEFGIHESLPIYSGGLGVLAGDHIKSASDLGVPLIGIGLFYTQGYFRQRIDENGWQQEAYIDVNSQQLPMTPAIGKDGHPVTVSVDTRNGSIRAKVWTLKVGRCTLLLLDSDVEGNAQEDRELTARLYHGDNRIRIRQELVLGVGGVRALHAMGIDPGVLHLNEGHSAFAALEMTRFLMNEYGLDFDEASRTVAHQTAFTTHTPVPAGHDRFTADLVYEHISPLSDSMGIPFEQILSMGRVDPDNGFEEFCMTVLALKMSRRANAVSSLHGHVSRRMWACLWPERNDLEVPIGHITNGVHVPSWLAPQMHQLFDRHLGVGWPTRSSHPEVWERIKDVDDGELWETHLILKSRLIDFVRRRTQVADEKRDPSSKKMAGTNGKSSAYNWLLSPDALTIGFARRFATYKRANLFLRDFERILDLVSNPQRPVQFVFAGKAHPRDEPGKHVLRQIIDLAKTPEFSGRIAFIEDYDINVGRHLVQGVDVWLNNPRRPLEASGTSGQKVVLNGGLNLSILDGWWAEAYDGTNGFAIGRGQAHASDEAMDHLDSESLYEVLSQQVIPMYYDRDGQGLPRRWISFMKNAIASLGWRFNADRMVMDYVRHCYLPAAGGVSSSMPIS